MKIILFFSISYLIGSFPTAYVLLKKIKNVDITTKGSGNVGALNSFMVSSSKFIGFLVLIIDLSKGILVAMITKSIFPENFWIIAASLGFAVLGHCYSPWIKFKGGKGLATAAGGSFIIAPTIFLIWVLFWIVSFVYKKKVDFANLSATILTLLISISSANIISKSKWFTDPSPSSDFEFYLPVALMLTIILTKHFDSIKNIFISIKLKGKN
jgi:glycerol-3-phosphate acyltransferase PlsY